MNLMEMKRQLQMLQLREQEAIYLRHEGGGSG